jgi:putative spermidine/putrescine transport system substrate-binding protein
MVVTVMVLAACSQATASSSIADYESWQEVIKDGEGKEVTILMWGGNESINQYMDTFVADHVKDMYNITLKRVPMNAPDYLAKLLNEKKNGVEEGTADLLWINAENFRTAKEGGLIDGPFTDLLPNLASYYDGSSPDLSFDSGIPIEGYEGIWGRAQLVLTYDEAVIPNPPRTFEELKAWAMENPGQFTYPKVPDDFVGVAFVRSAYYELNGQTQPFDGDLSKEAFTELSQPVMNYFNDIAPYLWREGTAYPATQAQLDDLFKNGEVAMTMGFEVGKTSGLVASGVYPETVKSYVLDTGTIGNAHYLAVPYNSPEKAAALLVMDFLQSPKAQIEKMKPEVWGDMPAVDPTAIGEEEMATLKSLDDVKGAIPLKELTDKRLPEMQATYIDWIKELWVNEVGK